MKIQLLLLSLCILSFSLNAQETDNTSPTDQGHFIVDGSVFFSFVDSTSERDQSESKNQAFALGISPRAAYFF